MSDDLNALDLLSVLLKLNALDKEEAALHPLIRDITERKEAERQIQLPGQIAQQMKDAIARVGLRAYFLPTNSPYPIC